VELDVTDGAAIDRVVGTILAAEGRIDALVNNAAIGSFPSSLEEIDEGVARAVWETNFWAPFRLVRAVLPQMRAQRSGVIVNISTYGCEMPGVPVLAMYGMSKSALSRLSESLEAELAGTGVRVIALEPGLFSTEIYSDGKRTPVNPASPYADLVASFDRRVSSAIANGGDPMVVAQAVFDAAKAPPPVTRLLVGDDAVATIDAYRRALVERWTTEATGP
jgi:NAD(P)-dependent dehydrogenase (short-subunit alcohol dehydrogenase family)